MWTAYYYDVMVLPATFDTRPDSWVGVCPSCRFYTSFGANYRLPIVSLLSAGGGPPVVSSGMLVSDSSGRYAVFLPTSSGTSGSPVFDSRGWLVGIVTQGYIWTGTEAGFRANILTGRIVNTAVRQAVNDFESK